MCTLEKVIIDSFQFYCHYHATVLNNNICTTSAGTNAFPIIPNVFEFSPEKHTLSIVVTDSTKLSDTYLYTFTGTIPPGILTCNNYTLIYKNVRIVTYDNYYKSILCDIFFSEDYVLSVSTALTTVNEDRTGGGNFVIVEEGYSFGDVSFIVRPLTYARYESITGNDVNQLFARRPTAASGISYELQLCH